MKRGLLIREVGGGQLHQQWVGEDGKVLWCDTTAPHHPLLAYLESSVSERTKEFRTLESHPFFHMENGVSDLEWADLVAQSSRLVATLRDDFPVAFFFSEEQIKQGIHAPDDGSATALLNKGAMVLQGAGAPYHTGIQLSNMMEICFGGEQELTHQQRYREITTTYPELGHHQFSVGWVENEQGLLVQEYRVASLLEYFWFCMVTILRSPTRICRCQHCWQYFVPKTKKKTIYCDRLQDDGRTCKDLGANLKRHQTYREDPYLQAFHRLQKRFYERACRGYASPKTDVADYDHWIVEASKAREQYLRGDMDGDTFLAAISDGEVVEPIAAPAAETATFLFTEPWESLVERNINFNPADHFEDIQLLDLAGCDPKWNTLTAEDLQRASKHGKISLQEKYGKK